MTAAAPEQPEGPLFRHGKLSYVQIPAVDAKISSAFYAAVFGWTISGSPAHVSFQDTSGDLIGAWLTGLQPASAPGILPYIYVQGLDAILARIEASGGKVVKPPYPEGDLWVATFRDPAGNVLGLWQAGGR